MRRWKRRSSVMAAIEHNESFFGRGGELTLALVDKIAGSVLGAVRSAQRRLRLAAQVSPSGGAGPAAGSGHESRQRTGPRMPSRPRWKRWRGAASTTSLAGGFHRYSVDERWVVPHFEKMLYDNTELLRNYVHGFQSLVREDFRRDGAGDRRLAGRDHDRPRAGRLLCLAGRRHQPRRRRRLLYLDAGRGARGADPAELEFASRYWDIGELGDMHHNPAKNVLHVKQTLEELAAQTGRPRRSCARCCDSARRKLLAARAAAAHAVYRPHALHGLERDGGDGVSGDGAGAAHGGGAGVCAAHARPASERSVGRSRALSHVIAYPDKAGEAGREGSGHAGRLRLHRARLH